MKILGLTGPSGAGKGEAGRIFASLGARVLDCDALYHEMLRTDGALRAELAAAFPDCADAEGGVDRKRLSRLVFADAEQLSRLNAIAHRHITRAIRETLEVYAREGAEVAVLDAPTLFEAHADALCDCTAAVLAPVSLRVERLRGRDGLPDEAILARIRSQPDDAFFQTHCTYILRNDGDLETLRGSAAALYNTIKENAT